MTHASDDRVFRQLSRLTPLAPDDEQAARIQGRCHDALARQRRARRRDPVEPDAVRRWPIEAIVGGVLAVAYAGLVAREALLAVVGR